MDTDRAAVGAATGTASAARPADTTDAARRAVIDESSAGNGEPAGVVTDRTPIAVSAALSSKHRTGTGIIPTGRAIAAEDAGRNGQRATATDRATNTIATVAAVAVDRRATIAADRTVPRKTDTIHHHGAAVLDRTAGAVAGGRDGLSVGLPLAIRADDPAVGKNEVI